MKWTQDKVDQLCDLAKKYTVKEISQIMNISTGAVRVKLNSLNVDYIKDTTHIWSEEKNNQFINLAKTHHYLEIASIMNISPDSVIQKARRLNIKLIHDHNLWTDSEIKTLKEEWGIKKVENIAKRLNKTLTAVISKAKKLGLGSMIEADKTILRVSDISSILHIHENTIRGWFNQGLEYEIRYVSEKQCFKYVTWESLLLFLKNHQDKWDSRKVDDFMLGEEANWLREKRRQDRINPIIPRRDWTIKEVVLAMSLIDKGKTYEEIGLILNRTPGAVARILQLAGHGINPDCYWLDEEIAYLEENYPHKTANEIALDLGKTENSVRGQIIRQGIQKTKKLTKKTC